MSVGFDLKMNSFSTEIRAMSIYIPDKDISYIFTNNKKYSENWFLYSYNFKSKKLLKTKTMLTEDQVISHINNYNLICHNSLYSGYFFKKFFNKDLNISDDSFIYSKLIPKVSLSDSDTLENCMLRYVNVFYKRKVNDKDYDNFNWEEKELEKDALIFCARDSKAVYDLFFVLKETYPEYYNTIYNLELKIVPLLINTRIEGILVDKKTIEEGIEKYKNKVKKFEKTLEEELGEKINPKSPAQVSKYLYEKLNLIPLKVTKSGFSTDKESLEYLEHPHADLILQGRELKDNLSSFTSVMKKTPYLEFLDEEKNIIYSYPSEKGIKLFNAEIKNLNKAIKNDSDGHKIDDNTLNFILRYVHITEDELTSLNPSDIKNKITNFEKLKKKANFLRVFPEFKPIHSAQTSRINTSKPDVNTWIPEMKNAIIPNNDKKLFYYCDIIAAEFMFLAFFANEEKILQSYASNIDIHKLIASQFFNIDISEVTDENRKIIKTIEYGILYGSEGNSIAKKLKISLKEAKELITLFFSTYQNIYIFKQKIENYIEENKEIITPFGRKRRLLFTENSKNLKKIIREGLNTYCQSGFADFFKMKLLKLYPELEKIDSKFKVFTYDSFLIEFDPEKVKKVDLDNLIKPVFLLKLKNRSMLYKFKSGVGKTYNEAIENSKEIS